MAGLALVFAATVALAANPHFVEGPDFSALGAALRATGKIAGIGNQPLTVVLEATAVTTCRNRGGNVPPGQTETVEGSVANLRPENGQVRFVVTTGEVSNPCPDDMRPRTTFLSAVLTVIQKGQVVLQEEFVL
jgi:hypothetical protein